VGVVTPWNMSMSVLRKAYRVIRDDLISLRIEPGASLEEKKLSASLEVGLTPVRDAIKRLTLERLLVTYPRRGTFAAEINTSDERWLTEARTGLEVLAAALAAQRASDVERAVLMELAEKLEGSKLSMVYIDRDADVHRAIYAAAHNPYLEATLNQYLNAALRIWHYALRSLGSHSPPLVIKPRLLPFQPSLRGGGRSLDLIVKARSAAPRSDLPLRACGLFTRHF
jgi:DNA-binding GntR family transcriptional regulator